MQIEVKQETGRAKVLAEGQIWRTGAADIEVVMIGKRLIHYRITRHLEPRLVSSQISRIAAMRNYLRANQARLEFAPARRPLRSSRKNQQIQSRSEIVIGSRGKLEKVGAHECPGTTLLECAARAV